MRHSHTGTQGELNDTTARTYSFWPSVHVDAALANGHSGHARQVELGNIQRSRKRRLLDEIVCYRLDTTAIAVHNTTRNQSASTHTAHTHTHTHTHTVCTHIKASCCNCCKLHKKANVA